MATTIETYGRKLEDLAHAQGLDNLDMAGVTVLYEQLTGVKVRGTAAAEKPGERKA